MLTLAQGKNLEDLQKRALKLIFGWDMRYEQQLSASGVETLQERRVKKHGEFALKIEANTKFQQRWLVENVKERETRKHNKYQIPIPRFTRQTKYPVYSYIHALNCIYRQ